jgi:hypothetical protein
MALTDHMKPCTIIRRKAGPTTNKYGRAVREPEEVETECAIQLASTGRELEPPGQDQLSDTQWLGFFPIDTVLSSADGVRQDGEEYEVTGRPWKADTGSVEMHHVEARLRQVKGPGDAS